MARINVRILENRGIYVKGQEVEMARAQGEQWINGGFAEYVPPAAKPKPKAAPKSDSVYGDLSSKELSAELKEHDLSQKGNMEEKIARLEENDAEDNEDGDD